MLILFFREMGSSWRSLIKNDMIGMFLKRLILFAILRRDHKKKRSKDNLGVILIDGDDYKMD